MTDEKKKDDGFTSFAKLMMGDKNFRLDTLMTAVALMIRNINAIENRLDALEKIAEHLENISLHLYSTQESVSDLADSVAVIETRTEQSE